MVRSGPHYIQSTKSLNRHPPISTTTQLASTKSRLESAFENVANQLIAAQSPAGSWEGQLSASALSTATAISAFSFYLNSPERDASQDETITAQIAQGLNWLKTQQNGDGGWGDTGRNYSNISTSMLVVAALHACGNSDRWESEISAAQNYIDRQGNIQGLRKRYGKDKTFAVPILANCAMAGIVPWSEVSALPFEAACVPQRFYNLMQLPVVSYAIPALVAIGQTKFYHDPPWDPFRKLIRRASIKRSLTVLERMQPASGGFLEAVPLTSFVSMGLIKTGKANHPVVQNGIRFLIESFRNEGAGQGSWPIDTNLATWNTTLSINALASLPAEIRRRQSDDSIKWRECVSWLLQCQNKEIHPFTGAAPGGWGWSDLSGAVPDADDTPGALLALKNLMNEAELNDSIIEAIKKAVPPGIKWLVNLQNRDRGWPTFCRGWGKLPFDRSGTDITAHALRSLIAWRDEFGSDEIERSITAGFDYLKRHQQKDGSWLPLWFGNQDQPDDINPFYGTAKVLMAYRDANSLDTNEAVFGLRWIRENQNPDGGWGGGISVQWSDERLGNSSVEETALCTEILLEHDDPHSQQAAQDGLQWLINACESNSISQPSPIGFYFAKLWYFEKMYPLIFATSALGRALNQRRDQQSD